MIYKIFTVYDNKAKAYLPPFFLPQLGQAIREFTYCANDPNHQFGKHPADYTLSELGQFDDSTGTIETLDQVEIHGSANQFLNTLPELQAIKS